MAVTFRNPAEDDLSLITSIINKSRRETLFHRDMTTAEVNAETFEDPDYSLDGAWLAFDGEKPIAYGIAVVEENRRAAGLDDGILEFDVLPGERRGAIEDKFMELALEYLRSRGVDHASARVEETEGWKEEMHLRHGFKRVRQFYRLAWRCESDFPIRQMPPDLEITHKMMTDMSDDEIAAFVEILNDTFSGHFDFAPQPVSRWTKWREVCEDPIMISLARRASETIAYCVVEDSRTYNAERGLNAGWIDLLGVRKAHRRHGLGTAMLVDGMSWLRNLGRDTIFLGVDSENEHALGLYKSLGFAVENRSTAYQLPLRPSPP